MRQMPGFAPEFTLNSNPLKNIILKHFGLFYSFFWFVQLETVALHIFFASKISPVSCSWHFS